MLDAIQAKLADPTSFRYVLERVEAEAQRLQAHLPEEIKLKRAALEAEERRVANYVAFIGEGKGTRALGEALATAEQKALALRTQLQGYEASGRTLFKAPPVEWIANRLREIQPVLETEPSLSALLLRRVLGPVRLVPVKPEIGKAYYQAETALQVLDLLKTPEGGSTWLRLVEAVGIEPTSGNPWRQASTSIADFLLLSLPGPPIGGISGWPAPESLAPHPGAGIGASHQNMTPVPGPC